MTPKERVLAALERREPDRVPHGEFATDYSVIEEALGRPVLWRAKRRLAEAIWQGRRREIVESMKRDTVDFTLMMGIDMVPVSGVLHKDWPACEPKRIAEDLWEDECGNLLKYSAETEDIGLHRPSGRGMPPPPLELPETPDASEMELVKHVVETLGKTHFVFARPGRAGRQGYTQGWTEDRFLRVAEDPEGVARDEMEAAERSADAIRPFAQAGVDGISIGADYGFNSGPFVSPATFRKVYFPAMKRRCEIIHGFGLPVLFHSCGNNRLILDQMVEAGMDAYQAIQPIERIEEIKAQFGDKLALWGGVSTDTLQRGTPDQVRHQALWSIKHCAPGGGLILSSSHSVVVRTPLDNYRALVETCRERGTYPINIQEELAEPAWAGG